MTADEPFERGVVHLRVVPRVDRDGRRDDAIDVRERDRSADRGDVDARPGKRFDDDDARQFSGNTEGELPPEAQRENVIRALVDGVGPIIETAVKVCPDCAESVKYLANVCRFCGYRF